MWSRSLSRSASASAVVGPREGARLTFFYFTDHLGPGTSQLFKNGRYILTHIYLHRVHKRTSSKTKVECLSTLCAMHLLFSSHLLFSHISHMHLKHYRGGHGEKHIHDSCVHTDKSAAAGCTNGGPSVFDRRWYINDSNWQTARLVCVCK
ncbi:hypothetical protein PLICRDRAFT_337700 [Plicaturopsis crispa FD-325 SS-3]|uniref:Uncharacterized protein n=1 Tax=Plicaturopsis crispa FD-325 SS-3 TaxID=944288 RepID=A0A0C9SYU4_PLICR|nr:hypothetical protein PLICRDRAFT_337700 [Plicaturopsis crispa FD-325 SS-3]